MQNTVDSRHDRIVKMAHKAFKPRLVQCANLRCIGYRSLTQASFRRSQEDTSRQPLARKITGERHGYDRSYPTAIVQIGLYDEHWTSIARFRANRFTIVCPKNISSNHYHSTLRKFFSVLFSTTGSVG